MLVVTHLSTRSTGYDHCPEGGAVGVCGGRDAGSDEDSRPIRRVGTQRFHEGERTFLLFIYFSCLDTFFFLFVYYVPCCHANIL